MIEHIYRVNKLDFDNLKDAKTFEKYSSLFSNEQLKEIYNGYLSKIDYKIYLNAEFTPEQMKQVRLGLEKGINVSVYVKPEFDRE